LINESLKNFNFIKTVELKSPPVIVILKSMVKLKLLRLYPFCSFNIIVN
jgi:hypothetical protein